MPPRKQASNKTKKKAAKKQRRFLVDSFCLLIAPFRLIGRLTRNLPIYWKWPLRLGLSFGLVALVIGLILSAIYLSLAYTYDLEEVVQMPARTEIHDQNGKILKNPDGKE